MQIALETRPFAEIETEALVTYVFEESDPVKGRIAELDRTTGGAIRRLAQSGEITGKSLEMTLLHNPAGLKAQRLLLVGAGKREQHGTAQLRKLAGAAVRHLKARSVKKCALLVREMDTTEAAAQAATEGLLFADFESDKYKTEKKNSKPMDSAALAGWEGASGGAAAGGIARGRIIAESQNFTRDLVNEPSNRLTPRMLAQKAEAMAREAGLACEILDDKKIAALKMGALLSVAQGSIEPPRVIVLTYTPASPKPGAPVLGLVGKAVTFDTGGISIKPAQDMEKMKYDMAGGATMLGVMRAIAALKPAVKVIAVVPATENMPGGRAQKPGDVQVAMSGKTIEVINTDAEGRLILADALTRACEAKPALTLDFATLTGAARAALGPEIPPYYTDDETLAAELAQAAREVCDPIWRMPLWDGYESEMDSPIADLKNTGDGAMAGSIYGALFLRRFV
ncbi:MAG: leucyl aminopeptidase, partial [Burkholderiales bacterium]